MKRKRVHLENLVIGVQMFARGLFKKVLIADIFAKAVNWGFQNSSVVTGVEWILIMLFYTFQIYFDFSGYSDMAIAVSKMFNIELPLNFDSPYKSYSIREFWKRWHISLTRFLTKYVYISLGGNRKGKFRLYVNMLLVFLVSGIWHGAYWTFILRGILHGLLCVMECMLERWYVKISPFFRWFSTFICVNVLWLLFRAESVLQWWEILKSIGNRREMTIHNELSSVFSLQEVKYIEMLLFPNLTWNGVTDKIHMLLFIVVAFFLC